MSIPKKFNIIASAGLFLILTVCIFLLPNCTDNTQPETDREEIDDRRDREEFELAERKSSRRSSNRRRVNRSSSGSSSRRSTNPYHPYIARNPVDDDGEPVLPRRKGGVCIGNLLWLRENCDRLPSWLDQAESSGYEKVEIKSNGDVIWHWGAFLGTWEDGTWKTGAFYEGTWIDGTWKSGFFRNGIWQNGVWEGGTWENGDFQNGTWKKGYWCQGVWRDGTWENGRWTNGVFENGTWEDGQWSYGEWQADNEDWKTGTCYSTNEDGQSESHNTEESPAHENSPCRNGLYEDFHNRNIQCD